MRAKRAMEFRDNMMTCQDVREVLSDLIDVRNGEIPLPGTSRLAENDMRAETEAHLAMCPACRSELNDLEMVGEVFAGFSVSELPPQHFENYGAKVRERMKRDNIIRMPVRANRFGWWKMAASAAVAACAVFGVVRIYKHNPMAGKEISDNNTQPTAKPKSRPARTNPAPTQRETPLIWYPPSNDAQFAGQRNDLLYNPSKPKPVVDTLTAQERKYGYIVMAENPPAGQMPLLGVTLRTMRDMADGDVDLSKRGLGLKIHSIQPGSVGYEMGLRTGDLLVTFNGEPIESGGAADAVKFLMAVHNAGKDADCTIHFLRRDEFGQAFFVRKGVLGDPATTRTENEEQ